MIGPFSTHLLRTFAAVPPASHILYFAAGDDPHPDQLRQLGFPVSVVEGSTDTLARINDRVTAGLSPELAAERNGLFATEGLLPLPAAMFDWAVASTLLVEARRADQLEAVLREIRRVVKPGGWIYVVVPVGERGPEEPSFTEAALESAMEAADLASAQRLQRAERDDVTFLQGIYRRVEADTIA